MTSALLMITSPRFRVELSGPARHPTGVLREIDSPAQGSLSTRSAEHVDVTWIDDDSNPHSREGGDGDGPMFYAETDYRLSVEVEGADLVRVLNRDPNLLRGVVALPAHRNLLTGSVNFRNQVGLAEIAVEADGEVILSFVLEVFPTKISYKSEYRSIVDDVSRTSRALALAYLRATTQSGRSIDDAQQTSIEWLTQVRNEVDDLERAMQYVALHPHRALGSIRIDQKIERIRRATTSTIRAISQGRGSGEEVALVGVGVVRSVVPGRVAVETLDNAENRWLRSNLESVRRTLATIATSIRVERDQIKERRPGANLRRLESEIAEVDLFEARLSSMLKLPPIAEAVGEPPAGFSSLTLMAKSGYREAYRSLLTLRLGLSPGDGESEVSLKDVEKLYETWCYIKVVSIVAGLSGASFDRKSDFPLASSGIRVELGQGSSNRIRIVRPEVAISILNNRSYHGATGTQRPDIVIEVEHDDWPPIVLILDAKYRLDVSDDYRARFGGIGPPIDAVNELHRYRDAIVVAAGNLGRPVVRGIALFPLGAESAGDFTSHGLWRSIDEVGIGAVPFTPGNTALAEEWLKSFLDQGPMLMSRPGPPFLAHEHLQNELVKAALSEAE